MKQYLKAFIALSLVSFTAMGQEEGKIKATSTIQEVTVFLSGAQVTRNAASIEIPKGVNYIVFNGVSPDIDEKSIQVKGAGNFTILSVSRQLNFLKNKETGSPDKAFQEKMDEYQEKLTALNNELEVSKAEEQMILKNQTVMNGNTSFDVLKLKQALDFQNERLKANKAKQTSLNHNIKKLNDEMALAKRQFIENNGITNTTSTDIAVKVSSNSITKGSFSISYLVKNAGWYPFYDLRAKNVTSKVNLVYKANVSQNSGEDWKNVKLTLSTGNPNVDNQIPSLRKYELGYVNQGYGFNFQNNTISTVSGKITDNEGQPLAGVSIRVKNSSLGTSTDGSGNYNLQLPNSNSSNRLVVSYIGFDTREVIVSRETHNIVLQPTQMALNETVVVGYGKAKAETALSGRLAGVSTLNTTTKAAPPVNTIEVETVEQPTNISFNIVNSYTILSDGKNSAVDIASYDVASDYEYYAVPKLNNNVYLMANLSDLKDLNLITGEASIFYDGTYLGKTLINTSNTSDTLNISLGIDKNIVISREKEKNFKETQFLGSNKKETRSFIINIRNNKNVPINLLVEDHLPIATNNDITVERQDISNAKYDENNGKLLWKLNLKPQTEEKLKIKYNVRSPRNSIINLE